MNPKDGFDLNEILRSFLDQSRRWGQELQTRSSFTVSLASFTVAFVQRKGYYSFQNEQKNSTREVGFHLSLKLKKRCIVGKKRATEVS